MKKKKIIMKILRKKCKKKLLPLREVFLMKRVFIMKKTKIGLNEKKPNEQNIMKRDIFSVFACFLMNFEA